MILFASVSPIPGSASSSAAVAVLIFTALSDTTIFAAGLALSSRREVQPVKPEIVTATASATNHPCRRLEQEFISVVQRLRGRSEIEMDYVRDRLPIANKQAVVLFWRCKSAGLEMADKDSY